MASKKAKTAAASALAASPLTDILKAIISATLKGQIVYYPAETTSQLVAEGLVETNPVMLDANKSVATRATQKGIDSMNSPAQTQTLGAGDVATVSASQLLGNGGGSDIVIEDNVPVPAVTGRGRSGTSVYPFDKLQVGQSFFVAKPAKNLASTVSSANARFSEIVEGQTKPNRKNPEEQVPVTRQLRQFVVRSVTEKRNGVEVKGSRVWRVEPKNEAPAAA